MFSIRVNSAIKVSKCGSFEKNDGSKGAYIIARECENQAENLERPSTNKYPVKLWLDELPEGVVEGGFFVVEEILGFDIRHVPATDRNGNRLTDRYGNPSFNDEVVLIATGIQGYPPKSDKPDKKNSKKQ